MPTGMSDKRWLTGQGARPDWADTEHERRPVKHRDQVKGGINDELCGILGNMVVEKAAKDVASGKDWVDENGIPTSKDPARMTAAQIEEVAEKQEQAAEEDDIDAIRARRVEMFKKRQEQMAEWKAKGHGEYLEIQESEFLTSVTKSKLAVVAFYHRSFERSKIVDMHLKKMCTKHMATKFCKLDAEKSPFFTGKLGIRTLPTIVLFVDGVAVHKIVGFIELGGVDDFKTIRLARIMKEKKILEEDIDEWEDEEGANDSEED